MAAADTARPRRRLGLATGDVLTLRSDHGPRAFPIAGVFNDYGADRGIALMLDVVYRAAWDDPRITNMAVTLRPGVDADAFTDELARRFGRVDGTRLDFRSNRSLRAEVFQVFDRAFSITTALQVLAVVVAFIGVLAALSAVQLERARENATLRATGMTVGQVIRLALTQTGLLGLVAGVLSWPAGLTLALILIYVINRRSFGWTIQTHIDPMIFARALVLAVAAARPPPPRGRCRHRPAAPPPTTARARRGTARPARRPARPRRGRAARRNGSGQRRRP